MMTKAKKNKDKKKSKEKDKQSEGMIEVQIEKANQTDKEKVEKQPTKKELLEANIAELEDKLLRQTAEFDNYKKRTFRQHDDMIKYAGEKVITELLEIADNFNRALEHKDENTNFDSFREGIELIYNQLSNLLDKYDVKPIESVGRPFDPNLHEALMQIESDEYNEGIIALEIMKGYKMGDRVIRHSKVGVARQVEKNDNNNEEDSSK
jgi:molecular chaperone GrpE